MSGTQKVNEKRDDGKRINNSLVSCEIKNDKRTIETKLNGVGCEVIYTKQEKADSVAKSHSDLGYCGKTVSKIREKLEKSGFQCQ